MFFLPLHGITVKVFRPWAGAILRTGPPFWRLGRIIRHVLLGHVLAAWLLEHLHGPRCPFLLLLLDYLLGVGFPSLFLWHLLFLGLLFVYSAEAIKKRQATLEGMTGCCEFRGALGCSCCKVSSGSSCVLISLQSEIAHGTKKIWVAQPS